MVRATSNGIRFIEPMYARLVQNLPEGPEWLYEVKFDGYRCLAGRDSSGVTLWSRRGNVFTNQFPHIAKACEQLPPGTLLDGEIIALDKNGRISFNLLQHHRSHAQTLLFYAFDVIVCRGKGLMSTPLEKRRTLLNEIFEDLGKDASPLCLSETMDAKPADLIRVAKEFGFEGIVAKRKTSLYEPSKGSDAWLKYRESTKDKSLLLADTSPIIHSIRLLLATTKTESYFMPPRCVTGSCHTPAVRWRPNSKACRSANVPSPTYRSANAPNGR
jgi:bifunctional non-homologous end joining protein LigD